MSRVISLKNDTGTFAKWSYLCLSNLQGAALVAVRILRANKKFDHTFHVRCLRTALDFYLISLKVQI